MSRIALTDRGVKALKPSPEGKSYEVMDAVVPGLGVRVSLGGKRTFVLVRRFPGSDNPTRRAMGEYGALTLEQARTRARQWLELIQRGKDPAAEEAVQRAKEARKREVLISSVVEDFAREKLAGERKGQEVARDLRRDLVGPLGNIPITEVTRSEIRALVKAKAKYAPAQARNVLGATKRFFSWAVDEEVYGLEVSPCADLKALKIIGAKPKRERDLSDDEIFVFWRAARRLPQPYAAAYQILLLNGLRLNEVADSAKPEFDFQNRIWTIPPSRMKGRNDRARAHIVPLTQASLELLAALPEPKAGPFLVSTTGGRSPAWIGDKIKRRLDAAMLRSLRALARKRGQDHSQISLPHWVNHDLRRTVRTNLSKLRDARGARIDEDVKEALLAHAKPGLKGIYDRYEYLDEKQEALELWAKRICTIVRADLPPANVVVHLREVA